jgi:tRNA-specific 2-thiouridylase
VGAHEGIGRYTVGQGKRLGNAAMVQGERQFVVATDPGRRRIVVGPRDAGTRRIALREVNWLAVPEETMRCTVKLRAHDQMRAARVRVEAGQTTVELDEPALPAPGQACVFYREDRVLGGGLIARTEARPGPDP